MRSFYIFLFLWMPLMLWAQTPQEVVGPQLVSGREVPWQDRPADVSRAGDRDTLELSVVQSFFDDFSSGILPDSQLWYHGNDRFPKLNMQGAYLPPSRGTAMFDGISPYNEVYQDKLRKGPSDRLESHFIDLSNKDSDSQIYLSFYYKAKGLGHAPSSRDSFKVYFNVKNGSSTSLKKVWATGGRTQANFRYVSIPVLSAEYFHTEFYITFENEGFLSGMLSVWHLDYVRMAVGRSINDSSYNDRSICYLQRPILDPYTAIPYQQYANSQPFMKGFDAMLSNLQPRSGAYNLSGEVKETIGGNTFSSPNIQNKNQPFSGVNHSTIAFNPYSDLANITNPCLANFQYKLNIQSSADRVPANDALTQNYRIDSVMAYDDGEAEFAYGLNRAKGFAQQYDVLSEDSMTAIWIHFIPQIDFNRNGSLEGKDFIFAIWNAPHPDSVIYTASDGMQVVYDDSSGSAAYIRYPIRATPVSGQIWVGIIQTDNVSIGMGMDRTYDNDNLVFWDSAGHWINSRMQGTLMLRPELRNIQFHTGPFAAIGDNISTQNTLHFHHYADASKISISSDIPILKLNIRIFNLQGQLVFNKNNLNSNTFHLQFNLSNGMYIIQYEGLRSDGQSIQGSRKIMVNY